ncbi:hypothetical protein AArcS_0676 [Natranaeroarchaeum sulfidigenes]|uniref:Uncharacterized protein n=1 Tax=Natranaeroarchaeum sulfidigenes TaxID=2784880 RepID=A0A897MSA5_9EURY|nr:hypothetical protein AArcS_0676 [Natranaeroarchaeum sulfidigenes]
MGDEHPATAMSLDAEFVENFGGILIALTSPLFELLPVFTYDVAARETPDWYHHTSSP